MFSRLMKAAPLGPQKAFRQAIRVPLQARYLATVETNTPRQMPVGRGRATPISHDRATFTIRVQPESVKAYVCMLTFGPGRSSL